MDKELFKETEMKLYTYYKMINKLYILEFEIKELERQREDIKNDIKNTNIFMNTDLNTSINYGDKVQKSNDGISYMEREMIHQINQYEKEIVSISKRIFEKKDTYRGIMRDIIVLKHNIKNLAEEERQILKYRYADNKSDEWISIELFGGVRSTAYRKRVEVVKNIASWNLFVQQT